MVLRLATVNLTWDGISGSTGYDILLDGVKVANTGSKARTTKISIPEGAEHKVTVRAQPSGELQDARFTWSSIMAPASDYLDKLTDFKNNRWTQTLVNRWGLTDPEWTLPSYVGQPWASTGLPGVQEIADGFKFIVTPEMQQGRIPNNGKAVFIADIDHLTPASFLGLTQEVSGEIVFPALGNPNGFPSVMSGVLWEWHTETMSGNNLCIDVATKKLKYLVYRQSDNWYDAYLDTLPIQFDKPYKWKIQLKWSTGNDGFFKGWINDVLIASRTGATIKAGEHPYIQFGYYAHTELRNEVNHTNIVVR